MSRVAFQLYLITEGDDGEAERVAVTLDALPRGLTAIQLRAPAIDTRTLLARAHRLREITAATSTPLLINDRIDVALAVGAEGAHLPARGLDCKAARRVAGDRLLVASTHSLSEARMAAAGGADAITLSPIWATATHPDRSPLGVAALTVAARTLPIPVFALGGIDAARVGEATAVGARVASLRGVLGAGDPATAAVRALQFGHALGVV